MTNASGISADKHAELSQLRHQTRTALTEIQAQLSTSVSMNEASRRVAAALERRILLTSQIADALYGLARTPGAVDERLRALCDGVIELMAEDGQYLTLECRVDGPVPAALQPAVLRVAHEFVANAVQHGMCVRLIGRIAVVVTSMASGTMLEVSDDGWGCESRPCFRDGLRAASALAAEVGGRIDLARSGERTVAQMLLPPGRPGPRA